MHDMASTNAGAELNGSLRSSQHHDSSANDAVASKRKRVDELGLSQPWRKHVQRDVLEVIQQHDTTPSFLRHEFETDSEARTSEPAAKKSRLSEPGSTKLSIAAKLSTAHYISLEQIKADATRVSQELVSAIRVRTSEKDSSGNNRPSVDDLKQIHRIQALEALIKEIADKEITLDPTRRDQDVGLKAETNNLPNGHTPDIRGRVKPSNTGTVLTLFGNAPTPKQLFSSMQRVPSAAATKPSKGSELMIEEMSLPNGLAATKVMAAPGDDRKKGTTLEETFAPPFGLAALQPPKPRKRPSTRDSTITWEFKDPVQRNSRKGGYTVQSLTVGDWLSYGGLEPEGNVTSPREKRKLRDRALSSGESTQQSLSRASIEETLAKEEEALFRRAFSSFAPSHDNARALVPEKTKNLVWWHKVGHKRFNDTFAIDPALLDESPVTMFDGETQGEAEPKDDDFNTIMDDLEEIDKIEPDGLPAARSKTDVDQVLREISELLETLASHQRIRNASLASSTSVSRTPISPAPTLASRIGKPDEPAEDELSTYASLRRELAYLVLKLPPYAVAKLNGDQLAELAIRKIIPLETKDIRGTLEEDQVSRQAKLAAMATASSIATLTRPSSSAGQHYNTTAQRTPAIGQAANTRYGQTTQYSARPPTAPQYQRPAPPPQYNTPSGPRPAYSQPTHQYGRLGPTLPNYGQSNASQYYQQRSTPQPSGSFGYNPHHEPSTQQRPSYTQQPMTQYPQRSHAGVAPAPAYSSSTPVQQNPYNPGGSAYKPPNYPAASTSSQPHSRPPYQPSQQQQPPSSSGRATPGHYPSQPQTPVNGYQQSPPPMQHRPPAGIASRTASATPQPHPSTSSSVPTAASNQPNGHP